jgi:hypothetical protein
MAPALDRFITDRQRASFASVTTDPTVKALTAVIRERCGKGLAAVLLYGSYLRGERDTVLDFYVLLHSYRAALPARWQAWLNRWLPPNVYFVRLDTAELGRIQAKYATVTLDRFERAMTRDFHSYFWARFAQPCTILQADGPAVESRVAAALADAVRTFARRAVPLLAGSFRARELWVKGLELCYRSELRAEGAGKAATLYEHASDYFDGLIAALAEEGAFIGRDPDARGYRNTQDSARSTFATACGWRVRRWQGALLSVLRLAKAALTFTDPLDYLLWKIERHSGVYIAPTERQRRYPLLFAWPLLWRIYKQGGFR